MLSKEKQRQSPSYPFLDLENLRAFAIPHTSFRDLGFVSVTTEGNDTIPLRPHFTCSRQTDGNRVSAEASK